jgi:leader peptidase (prepilin peptidase)/N-methyltransferase
MVGATALGACIGSFLNVCIYRWPRDMKVNEPARSFCPLCKRAIRWYENLPMISWLALRGRCAGCHEHIPFRYFLVEALTAVVFLLIWWHFPPAQAVAYALLATACIVTVFVDFEHYIIPNQVTWGVLPLGLVASALVPSLHEETFWLRGLFMGALGAGVGLLSLWLVVEGGKRLFGKKTRKFEKAINWELREGEEAPSLVLGEEIIPWDDLFSRESDRLIIEGSDFEVNGRPSEGSRLVMHWNRFAIEDGKSPEDVPLEKVKSMRGKARRMVIPREAMGFGDVKFLAMAGAFIGWKGALFTIFAASLYGTIFGLGVLLINRKNWAGRIPFGPWLVVGVWTWVLFGKVLLNTYLELIGLGPNVLF